MARQKENRRVTFKSPFTLSGVDGVIPSGSYSVETRNEAKGLFSFLKTSRTSTWIRISRNHGISGILQAIKIDPTELSIALKSDTELSEVVG